MNIKVSYRIWIIHIIALLILVYGTLIVIAGSAFQLPKLFRLLFSVAGLLIFAGSVVIGYLAAFVGEKVAGRNTVAHIVILLVTFTALYITTKYFHYDIQPPPPPYFPEGGIPMGFPLIFGDRGGTGTPNIVNLLCNFSLHYIAVLAIWYTLRKADSSNL